jgi:hypothetical protein
MPRPPTFDVVRLWGELLVGPTLETDLADEIAALEAGRPYRTPEWMNSNIYWSECETSNCGNRPELKYETLRRMVADAIGSWELVLYV